MEQAFPPEQLFMGVDSIEPGLDFVKVLNEQVGQCDVFIAVIGPQWIDARDKAGARRLDNPDDFVRIEIEAALQQEKRVIPVLVGHAQMPTDSQLPETMKSFARRHGVRLTHDRFRADTQGLIAALQRALKGVDDVRAAQPQVEATQEEERRRDETGGFQRATDEKSVDDDKARVQARPPWPQSWPLLAGGSLLLAAATVSLGLWLFAVPITQSTDSLSLLSPDQERELKPKDTFRECVNCPQMRVMPAGSFTMGSPASEPDRNDYEGPQHEVTIAQQFAVGQFELTFDEWDACIADGGCNGHRPSDEGWGRGHRPVISVSWNDAKAYVVWLAKKTGKPYRLFTEAEYEYAARAGTTTVYPWGDDIGRNNANCTGCGGRWDNKQTAPVGSFAANGFGLYDMVGNAWTWIEECWHYNYNGAPTDGSAWTSGDCSIGHVVRSGSWLNGPRSLRSANRSAFNIGRDIIGFRVARTLLAP